MRLGWLTASDYEWTQHWRIASASGSRPPTFSVYVTGAPGASGYATVLCWPPSTSRRDGAVSAGKLRGVRARRQRRPGGPDRTGHRDRAWRMVPTSCAVSRSRSRTASPAGRRTASARLDDSIGLDRVGHHVAVGVGGGDLVKISSLRRRTVRAWHSRSECLAAPTYCTVIATVEALAALIEVVTRPRRCGARGVKH